MFERTNPRRCAMKVGSNFLCDLWMALSQFSRHENMSDKIVLLMVDTMSLVEKTLFLKLQDEVPILLSISFSYDAP